MSVKTYYLRAPDLSSMKKDIKNILENVGADVFNSGVLVQDEDGNISFDGTTIAAFEAGTWPEQPYEFDKDDNITQQRVDGDHAIATARTSDEQLQDIIESFSATDPKLDPSEVPASNKQPNGTSRINPPSTPIRPIATK